MNQPKKRVIVVGGGVIGAACAYYLSRNDWTVSIIERDEFGRACSHGNCGLVSPSHVLPLAIPGAVGDGFRSMLSGGSSPLSIKPTLNPARLAWFWKFARRCNRKDMLAAGVARQALLQSSMTLYETLLENEKIECEWQKVGGLYAHADEKSFQKHTETAELLNTEFNVSPIRFDGDAVCEFEPTLRKGLVGGWLYEVDAHLRPDLLLRSWRNVLEDRGVSIIQQCELTNLIGNNQAVAAAATSRGEMKADAFVIAAGAETPQLANAIGWKAPIQPGKGYSISMDPMESSPRVPIHFSEKKVVATPMKSVFRLGSTMEFAGYDRTLNQARLQALRDGAAPYLRNPQFREANEEWWGWRPMTTDGLPFIGRAPKYSNVWVAAGHNMLGLSMATATGKLMAELMDEQETHMNADWFALNRA